MEAAELRKELAKADDGSTFFIRNAEGKIVGTIFKSSQTLENGQPLYLIQAGPLRTWFTGVVQDIQQQGEIALYCKELRMGCVSKASVDRLEKVSE